jgi:hypothetical protein
MINPTGYLRGIHVIFDSFTTTNLQRDPDDPYDPDDDPPFTLTWKRECDRMREIHVPSSRSDRRCECGAFRI